MQDSCFTMEFTGGSSPWPRRRVRKICGNTCKLANAWKLFFGSVAI